MLVVITDCNPYSKCPTLSPDKHPKKRGILLLQNVLSHFAQLLCFYPPVLFSFDISYYILVSAEVTLLIASSN